MSSSVFSVIDSNEDGGQHTIATLLPVNLISDDGTNVMLELNGLPSLPGLDEFCQNNSHVNAIFNMLSHNSNSEYVPPELSVEHNYNSENQDVRCLGNNGGIIFDMKQSIDDPLPTSDDQGCPSSTQGPLSSTPTLKFRVQVGGCEEGINAQEPLLGTGIHKGSSLIGQDQHMTPPSTSQNYEGLTETNRIGNDVRHTSENLRTVEEPNEEEIDEAFQNVFSGFNQATEKEILAILDAGTLKNCLDHIRSAPLLICNFCYEIFHHISPFQVHIQTCCDQPRELQQKMDQSAMDQLARSLWKSAFLKELKSMPISHNIMQHEGYLDNELNQLWLSGSLESILKCRDIFIRAAVGIVSRRWVANAVANELTRVRAVKPKQPKKRAKVETDTDHSIGDQTPSTSDSKKRKTRGRLGSKNTKKSSETDLAVRGLISDETISKTTHGRKSSKNTRKSTETDFAVRGLISDETISNTTLYHVTPETPVSDHGISDVMPLLNHSMDEMETPRPMNSREDSVTTPISDSGVDLTPEMDYELDRIVREVPDVDLLVEAAKGFDNLDNASDVWENNATADEPLSENEFVVGKILDRRLLYKVEDFNPLEEDYEYLVSWEGYGEEGNTWEPYEHLKHCTQKLAEYRERLKQKALRCRRGKRI